MTFSSELTMSSKLSLMLPLSLPTFSLFSVIVVIIAIVFVFISVVIIFFILIWIWVWSTCMTSFGWSAPRILSAPRMVSITLQKPSRILETIAAPSWRFFFVTSSVFESWSMASRSFLTYLLWRRSKSQPPYWSKLRCCSSLSTSANNRDCSSWSSSIRSWSFCRVVTYKIK